MVYCAWSWSHFGQSWSSQAWQNQATLFFHPVCWLLGTLVGAGAFGATAWATAWARVGLARPEPVAISASVELAASTGTGLVASTGSGLAASAAGSGLAVGGSGLTGSGLLATTGLGLATNLGFGLATSGPSRPALEVLDLGLDTFSLLGHRLLAGPVVELVAGPVETASFCLWPTLWQAHGLWPHGQRHLPARSLAIPILEPWLALEFWFDTLLWSGLQVFGAPLATWLEVLWLALELWKG